MTSARTTLMAVIAAAAAGLRRSTGREPRAWRAHATAARIHRRRGLVLASRSRGLDAGQGEHRARRGRRDLRRRIGGNVGAAARHARLRARRLGHPDRPRRARRRQHAVRGDGRTRRVRRCTGFRRGTSIEIDTPRAAFTIERPGYYRVDVDDQRTSFGARRGGIARVVAESGDEIEIRGDQELVLGRQPSGLRHPADRGAGRLGSMELRAYVGIRCRRRVARRTCRRTSPASTISIATATGRRSRATGGYGVPREVAPDWSPYSTGRWVYDPYYEWTWVDDAPWGWAPYHYGRWV